MIAGVSDCLRRQDTESTNFGIWGNGADVFFTPEFEGPFGAVVGPAGEADDFPTTLLAIAVVAAFMCFFYNLIWKLSSFHFSEPRKIGKLIDVPPKGNAPVEQSQSCHKVTLSYAARC